MAVLVHSLALVSRSDLLVLGARLQGLGAQRRLRLLNFGPEERQFRLEVRHLRFERRDPGRLSISDRSRLGPQRLGLAPRVDQGPPRLSPVRVRLLPAIACPIRLI